MSFTFEQYANGVQTTLSGGINSSVTALTLASGTGLPSSGNFRLLIDSEIMTVTGVAGAVLTVVRGQEGTAAASHLTGATATVVLTAGGLQALSGNTNLVGTFANLPTAGFAGRTYRCTDSIYSFVDTGSAWQASAYGHPCTLPQTSGWSWLNQGTATLDTSAGTIRIANLTGNGGAFGMNAYVRSLPASPYSVVWGINIQLPFGDLSWGGPVIRNSGSGNLIEWRNGRSSGFTSFHVENYNSPTSLNGDALGSQAASNSPFHPLYMKLTDDGTNRNWYISDNPLYFPVSVYSDSRTNFLTADTYGIAITPYNFASALELFHVKEN